MTMVFVVNPTLSRRDVVQEWRDKGDLDLSEIGRMPTARGSLDMFLEIVDLMANSGKRSGVALMRDVGIVIRNTDGERVWCPCGRRCAPTLWCALDQPERIMGLIGDHVAIRVRADATPACPTP